MQRRVLSHRARLAVRFVGLLAVVSYGVAADAGPLFAVLAAASVYLEARRPDRLPAGRR